MLDEGAHVRELFLLVRRQILRGEFRMRDENPLRPHFARRFHQLENFHAPEVPRRQNHVVLARSARCSGA